MPDRAVRIVRESIRKGGMPFFLRSGVSVDSRADQWMPEPEAIDADHAQSGAHGLRPVVQRDSGPDQNARGLIELDERSLIESREQDESARGRVQLSESRGERLLETRGQRKGTLSRQNRLDAVGSGRGRYRPVPADFRRFLRTRVCARRQAAAVTIERTAAAFSSKPDSWSSDSPALSNAFGDRLGRPTKERFRLERRKERQTGLMGHRPMRVVNDDTIGRAIASSLIN